MRWQMSPVPDTSGLHDGQIMPRNGAAGAMRGDVPALLIAFLLGTVAFGFQSLDLRSRRIETLRRDGYRL